MYRQGLLAVFNRLLISAQGGIGYAEIGERDSFIRPILQLAFDRQGLLVAFNRLLITAQRDVGDP